MTIPSRNPCARAGCGHPLHGHNDEGCHFTNVSGPAVDNDKLKAVATHEGRIVTPCECKEYQGSRDGKE